MLHHNSQIIKYPQWNINPAEEQLLIHRKCNVGDHPNNVSCLHTQRGCRTSNSYTANILHIIRILFTFQASKNYWYMSRTARQQSNCHNWICNKPKSEWFNTPRMAPKYFWERKDGWIDSDLPTAIKDLSNDKNKFKPALKRYLLHNSFYSNIIHN
jgi:hypothetical protein